MTVQVKGAAMSTELNGLRDDIAHIKRKLDNARPAWLERLFWFIEKMLIPLAVAGLAYSAHWAAGKISTGQLRLAEASANDRKAEFQRSLQSKYVELFYADITSIDEAKQRKALQLLKVMEPELALRLSELAENSPTVVASVRAQVAETRQQLQVETERAAVLPTGPLSGFTVGIYYLSSDPKSQASANAVARHLTARGLGATVRLYARDAAFFDSVVPPDGLEVRYEEGLEDRQAQVLIEALAAGPLGRKAAGRQVGSTTRSFLSVFVPAGG